MMDADLKFTLNDLGTLSTLLHRDFTSKHQTVINKLIIIANFK